MVLVNIDGKIKMGERLTRLISRSIYVRKYMKLEKRIVIQQKIIESLQEEKQQLIKENKQLQDELDNYEENKLQKEENIKFLESKLTKCIEEYEKIISSAKEIQMKYEEKIREVQLIKKKYESEIKKLLNPLRRMKL